MTILDEAGLERTCIRLSREVMERSEGADGVVLVGIKRGGEVVARRIAQICEKFGEKVPCAGLDISMTRDDLASASFLPEAVRNLLPFPIEGKTVVLCDDILHTGRSAAAGIEALFKIGRPRRIRMLALVDRGGREVPVHADFAGKNVPTSKDEYIRVRFTELGDEENRLTIERRKPC